MSDTQTCLRKCHTPMVYVGDDRGYKKYNCPTCGFTSLVPPTEQEG